jgi:hypothetical protein
MTIPLYGFQEGDTIGLLVIAEEHDTVATLAGKLQAAADLRVAPREDVEVIFQGRPLDPGLLVMQTGLAALDRFDVRARR